MLEREDPVDSLIVRKGESWKSLEALPDGSVVETSSVRRVAPLKRLFPKLVFKDLVSACTYDACPTWYTRHHADVALPLRPSPARKYVITRRPMPIRSAP